MQGMSRWLSMRWIWSSPTEAVSFWRRKYTAVEIDYAGTHLERKTKVTLLLVVLMTHFLFESLFVWCSCSLHPELKRMSLAYYYMSKISTTVTSHVLTHSVYLCCLPLLLQRVLKLHFFICDSYIQILARYYYMRTAYPRI